MKKYVEIYYDKTRKTQRAVIVGAEDCTSKIEKELKKRHIPFTNHKFIGEFCQWRMDEKDFFEQHTIRNIKNKTYKYAQKWQWLNTVHLV